MKECEKIYKKWKSETKMRLSKNETRKLLESLVANGISKEKILQFRDLFKIDTETSVRKAGKNKTDDEIGSWISDILQSFDDFIDDQSNEESGLTAGEKNQVSSEELNARKAGFLSRKHFDEYVRSAPLISQEELRKIEEKRNERWNKAEADKFEKYLEELLKSLN